MKCIVTAGPTFEPLDQARRLTNFSTGRLGTELATHLAAAGHEVTLVLGEQATYRQDPGPVRVRGFTTTSCLQDRLTAAAREGYGAVFHAAAVSDFAFGKVWTRSVEGVLTETTSGKYSTRVGPLIAELLPTPKIIGQLRTLFADALIVGWKYEVEGDRAGVIDAASRQLGEYVTDACVANGPAYGDGFGLVRAVSTPLHLGSRQELYRALESLLPRTTPASR
jgi:phosphopantothenoylcysteine decarboxylase/phosphopantothenate--cysteine ligase